MGEPLPEHRYEPQVFTPLTQEEVRGLFTYSEGSNVARMWFDEEFPNVVHVMTLGGHFFDANFACGLDRFIQNCSDNLVNLQRDACVPLNAAEAEPKDSGVEEVKTLTQEQEKKVKKGKG